MAQPCKSYPLIFSRGTIFDRYPFLLPNLLCATILGCGVVVGTLFLEETHEERRHRRDWGLELGNWLLSRFEKRLDTLYTDKTTETEIPAFEDDEAPPGYCTVDGTPRASISNTQSGSLPLFELKAKLQLPTKKPSGVGKAFTRPVIFNIVSFGILA